MLLNIKTKTSFTARLHARYYKFINTIKYSSYMPHNANQLLLTQTNWSFMIYLILL